MLSEPHTFNVFGISYSIDRIRMQNSDWYEESLEFVFFRWKNILL